MLSPCKKKTKYDFTQKEAFLSSNQTSINDINQHSRSILFREFSFNCGHWVSAVGFSEVGSIFKEIKPCENAVC